MTMNAKEAQDFLAKLRQVIDLADAGAVAIMSQEEAMASRDASGGGQQAAISGGVKDNTGTATRLGGRRYRGERAGSPTASPSEATAPSATTAEGQSAESPTPAGRGSSRRRGGAAAAASSSTPTPTPSAPDAASGRSGRRRTPASGASTQTISPSDDKVTDADLLKAASAAAQKITPAGVMEVVTSFGVENLVEIAAKDRKAFLSTLKAKVAVA